MSDKETAPSIPQLALEIRNLAHLGWTDRPNLEFLFREIGKRAQKISEFAVECTAPAPKSERFGDWCDMKGIEPTMGQVDAFVREQVRAATCDHFWRTVAVNPKWSWFTECEKCKIGAPLKLQAENYVEGTSEQASPTPDAKD